jgi:hypothetical protein
LPIYFNDLRIQRGDFASVKLPEDSAHGSNPAIFAVVEDD